MPPCTSVCPVCNGFETLHAFCPECAEAAEDLGRFNDFLGPYSPYREIDDVGLTNGLRDVSLQQCAHVLHCKKCGHTFIRNVDHHSPTLN